MDQLDYSFLDIPEILRFMFSPRADWTSPPPGVTDHSFAVQDGVHLSGRIYPHGKDSPSILFFHGNGEVASDYDGIAPLYNRIEVNLFVVDYRGYGKSDGTPTVTDMASDSHFTLDAFCRILEQDGYLGPVYVMGRSLGAYSAIELAAEYPSRIKGVITESGSTSITRAVSRFSLFRGLDMAELDKKHREKVRSIITPLLIIHGDRDTLVPIELARELYETVGSTEKRFVTIQGAGHNDILAVGMEQYFQAIRKFVFDSG